MLSTTSMTHGIVRALFTLFALSFALAVSLALGTGCEDGGDPAADATGPPDATGVDAHCRDAPLEGCPCEQRAPGYPRLCCAVEYDGTQLVCERTPRPQDAVWQRRDDRCSCTRYSTPECNSGRTLYRRCIPYATWLDQ